MAKKYERMFVGHFDHVIKRLVPVVDVRTSVNAVYNYLAMLIVADFLWNGGKKVQKGRLWIQFYNNYYVEIYLLCIH